MPLWLRKTTFYMIKEFYEKEAEEHEKQQNQLKNKGKLDVSRPSIPQKSTPTYSTKAPKK